MRISGQKIDGYVTQMGNREGVLIRSERSCAFVFESWHLCLITGGEPKFSYVGRTVTVDKALFESFKNKSKGRRSSGLFTAFLQPRDENEVVEDVNPSHRNSRCGNENMVYTLELMSCIWKI